MLSYGPPFSICIHESWNLGKPYGIKLRCYWESLGEQLWNLGNPMGTWWEHIWEQGKKTKITSPSPLPNRKKTECIERLLIDCIYFQNCLSSFSVRANGRGTKCGLKSGDFTFTFASRSDDFWAIFYKKIHCRSCTESFFFWVTKVVSNDHTLVPCCRVSLTGSEY